MKGQLLRIAVQWPSQPVQSKASEMRLCMYIRVLVCNCTWWVSLLRWVTKRKRSYYHDACLEERFY